MMRLLSCLFPVLGLLPAILAETWSITNIHTHFMGTDSGLPGGVWPPSAAFNTTVDFVFQRQPDDAAAAPIITTCAASFVDGSIPRSWMHCADGTTAWRFRLPASQNAANITLELLVPAVERQATATQTTRTSISFATVHVTANSFSIPSAFMTCIGGAPFTGIHCGFSVDNVKIGQGGPIPLTYSTGYAEPVPFLVGNITATSAARNGTADDCVDNIGFSVLRTINGNAINQGCANSWTCLPSTVLATPLLPTAQRPFACAGPLPYQWWTSPSSGAALAGGFGLGVSTVFCQNTFFRSLDGAEVDFNVRILGTRDLRAGNELVGACTADGECTYTGKDAKGLEVPVSGYEVNEDRGCGAGGQ